MVERKKYMKHKYTNKYALKEQINVFKILFLGLTIGE
jgi:hypothetical protein